MRRGGLDLRQQSNMYVLPPKHKLGTHPHTYQETDFKVESRKVPIPPHRVSPLKAAWPKMYPPLVEHLKLQVRMNVKSKCVELRNHKKTTDPGALQKGEDFVKAFSLGFDGICHL